MLPEIDDICLVTTGDAFHWIAPAPGIAVHPSVNARSWARIARQTSFPWALRLADAAEQWLSYRRRVDHSVAPGGAR
ncbi:hypothetical protein OG978_37125 [Streptomyces sp. NBC_01591]|uniref:hypothetical protein n=1 Tax=Streptomyces sp. NBC_01591 TaxID=2975888 RepID=UPI002DDB883D|nr:hypothetical protein [Streptomyces sp. NBC_01591]WSD72532.1 hypothetical protein OG978_37125 [Streptomyces sp. NBC_01591]